MRPTVRCAIGNGVVLDPLALVEEFHLLEEHGISWGERLRISLAAHLVTPLHRAIEALDRQDLALGTTGRGIGPAYQDKVGRWGLRLEDLITPERFRERLREVWERAMVHLASGPQGVSPGLQFDALCRQYEIPRKLLAPLAADVTDLLLSEDEAGARILCEGAQGALLDLDHGTYPYVTSSNTTAGGACTGLGIPPRRINRVIGVAKAYATRVGLGPFPTEFQGERADRFRARAGEYGATTGRPRRCGWFDAVLARRTCRINGVDELIVTKLDVLTGFEKLQVAVGYGWPGDGAVPVVHPGWPGGQALEAVEPQYRQLPGWTADLEQIGRWSDLPPEAQAYLDRLADELGVPVGSVSVGPGREQVLTRDS
jgi:adenylosuccinate synthase